MHLPCGLVNKCFQVSGIQALDAKRFHDVRFLLCLVGAWSITELSFLVMVAFYMV